jgi:hypothetical protein
VDLSPYLQEIGNQGKQGSCAAWATSYTALGIMFNHAMDQRLGTRGHHISFSPAYSYNLVHRGQCGGTPLTTMLETIRDNGVAKLQEFPYNPNSCSRVPDGALIQRSKPMRLLHYSIIDARNAAALDKIRGAIYEYRPVVIGLNTGGDSSAFVHYRGGIFNQKLPQSGGHGMVIVGYNDANQTFTLANSWGKAWGENGFMRISYNSLLTNLMEPYAYVIDKIDPRGLDVLQASLMPPAPTPEPAPLPPPKPKPAPKPAPAPRPVPAPKPAPAPAPQPAPLPAPAPAPAWSASLAATRITALPQAHDCARIRAEIQGEQIVLHGFSGDKNSLLAAINALNIPPRYVVQPQALRSLPWPQCEIAESYALPGIWQAKGLRLQVEGSGSDGITTAGSSLKVQLSASVMPSYLYVFYIQAARDHNAVPLYQPLFDRNGHPLPEKQGGIRQLNDPAPGLHRDFVVTAPFGAEVILAIQTRTPLFRQALAADDWNERTLLTRLRSELASKRQQAGIIATDAVYLTTRE